MHTRTFKLRHSLLVSLVLVIVEYIAVYMKFAPGLNEILILIIAAAGAAMTIYIATEAIEEVKESIHFFVMLSIVIAEFVIFFAFQYGLLGMVQPMSFPVLPHDALSLLLCSVMAFVLNPIYLPATAAGKALLLIETFGALGLVLFVLQNISALHKKS